MTNYVPKEGKKKYNQTIILRQVIYIRNNIYKNIVSKNIGILFL